ncbi:MAG: superoxide dismutase [Parcubacteria group bacterium]|nr:superoxide dismutase [Parcubacteria group bacterium]
MHVYQEKKFTIPELKGISPKQLEVHLGLYAGYVKHVNLLREKIHELEAADKEKNAYTIAELRRRFSFEFNGMRMHEYYFEQWEKGPKTLTGSSALAQAVSEKYGSWENFISHFKTVGMSRGIGWTVLYWDPTGKTPASPAKRGEPHTAWVGDHELGTLAGLPVILALDMWEHAFMVDYTPAEKGKYIDAFLLNLNWSIPEERFKKAQ